VIGFRWLLTGCGENSTTETTSRAFVGTLDAGMEVSPLGSLTAPDGRGSVTTGDSADVTVVDPSELRAVRLKRILWPTSADDSRYVLPFALSVAHSPPAVLHRSQRYENEMGCFPVHDPGLAVTTEPFVIVPCTTGSDVFTGTPTTTPVGLDAAVFEPSAFIAVTRTRSLEPTSARASL
jgi:hypothetical protein